MIIKDNKMTKINLKDSVFTEDDVPFVSTHKVGDLYDITYYDLVAILGEPTYNTASADDKVQKEWVIDFEGYRFTIYDWKTYDQDYTINSLTTWSVGGTGHGTPWMELCELIHSQKDDL